MFKTMAYAVLGIVAALGKAPPAHAAPAWSTALVCWGFESDRFLVIQTETEVWSALRRAVADEGPLLSRSRAAIRTGLKGSRRLFLGPAHDLRERELSGHRTIAANDDVAVLWFEMYEGSIFTMDLKWLFGERSGGRLLEHDLRWGATADNVTMLAAEGEMFRCLDFDQTSLAALTLRPYPRHVVTLEQALCESKFREITQD